MTELLGGALMVLGGGGLTAVALYGAAPRSPIDQARELLGNSDAAVPKAIPIDMAELLARLD